MSSPRILINIITSTISMLGFGSSNNKNRNDILNNGNKAFDAVRKMKTNGNIKEITQDNLLYYPILFTNDISIENMRLINKAFELEYANLFKLLINSIQIDTMSKKDIEDGKARLGNYLKKYHTNLDINENTTLNGLLNDLNNINKNEIIPLEEKFEFNSLNNYTLPKYILEFTANSSTAKTYDIKNSMEIEKRLNGLDPILVKGKINFKVEGLNSVYENNVVFGIKAVTHILDSKTSENFITNNVKETNKALQLIKWRTGEIKLLRDIILAVDLNKSLALKNTRDKDSNYWWAKLNLLAQQNTVSNVEKSIFGPKKEAPIATTTLVLSKQTVDQVKYNTGIDLLRNSDSVKKILSNFFLLTFAIVDESTETIYIYNEKQRVFDSYSFNEIKVKTGSEKNNIKDLIELASIFKR